MINFKDLPGCREFEFHALPYLRTSVARFFGGDVKYDARPLEAIRHQHDIDIAETPRRGVYILKDGQCAVMLGRVLQGREVVAAFALQLTGASLSGLEKLLNDFESALAFTLTRSAPMKFSGKPHQFGDELVELAISKFFSKGYYDHRKVQLLIDLFHGLANARFEGRNFTTGLVLTRSHYAYAEKSGHSREGKLFPLVEGRQLSPAAGVEKRFWYLADGQTSFFVANPALEISNLFLAKSTRQSLTAFVDDYTLSKIIKGGDVLLRVTSQSEFSVTGSSGIEFGFREGGWRVKNLGQLASLICDTLQVKDDFVQALLFYVFYLSRRRLSSILWVPMDVERVDQVLLSRNRLTRQPLSILDESHTQSLLRLLTSDGAAVFARDGSVLSYGSVVDISKVQINGLKGTGESVAGLLGSNGLAVKISQDGTIKLYAGGRNPMLI